MKTLCAVLGAMLMLVSAGCGGGSPAVSGSADAPAGGGAVSNEVLRTAYQDDPGGGIDPDVFYGVEGESMITSIYEGLVSYRPESTEIQGQLAERWTVSPDGRTYRFTLRKGVHFHDGTPFDAAAAKASLERRRALKQAVSYVLADVKRIEAPSSTQLVLVLKQRNNSFLDMMASMYGPKMISPTAVKAHAGKDDGQRWLAEHAVGTGPYKLESYRIGQAYKLVRNDDYWGRKPYFRAVQISVVPDMGTQRLQLSAGDLDLITHGLDVAGIPSVQRDPNLELHRYTAALRHVAFLNTSRPPFDDPQVRRAFASALDLDNAVAAVYGDTGRPPVSGYPAMLSRDGQVGRLTPRSSAQPLPERVKIVMAYASGSGETGLQRLAQYLQASLKKAGFDVVLKGDTYAQEFSYATNIEKAPNALLSGLNPDAASPDSWGTTVWGTGGGLNLLKYSNPKVDEALAAARTAPSPAEADAFFDQAAKLVEGDAAVIPIDDFDDVVASRKGITGLTHVPLYVWQVTFADLRRG